MFVYRSVYVTNDMKQGHPVSLKLVNNDLTIPQHLYNIYLYY